MRIGALGRLALGALPDGLLQEANATVTRVSEALQEETRIVDRARVEGIDVRAEQQVRAQHAAALQALTDELARLEAGEYSAWQGRARGLEDEIRRQTSVLRQRYPAAHRRSTARIVVATVSVVGGLGLLTWVLTRRRAR
jgi:hypothetical protein